MISLSLIIILISVEMLIHETIVCVPATWNLCLSRWCLYTCSCIIASWDLHLIVCIGARLSLLRPTADEPGDLHTLGCAIVKSRGPDTGGREEGRRRGGGGEPTESLPLGARARAGRRERLECPSGMAQAFVFIAF